MTMVFRTDVWNLKFAKQYGFQDTTSSPLYPQLHGQAEKGVQIFKRLLKKVSDGKSDPYLASFRYRAAPLESGVELLMNDSSVQTIKVTTIVN